MDNRLIRALIVDDDKGARNILHKYLESIDDIGLIYSTGNAADATNIIQEENPNIVFLDINMPGEDGIQLATRLRASNKQLLIVFTTAFQNYALDVFPLKPVDYLVKPFGLNEVALAISKVRKKLKEKHAIGSSLLLLNGNQSKIRLRIAGGSYFFVPSEVVCFNAIKGGVEVIYTSGAKEDLKISIASVERDICSMNFIRISRSSIINVAFLYRIDKKLNLCYLKCNDLEFSFELTKNIIRHFESVSHIRLG